MFRETQTAPARGARPLEAFRWSRPDQPQRRPTPPSRIGLLGLGLALLLGATWQPAAAQPPAAEAAATAAQELSLAVRQQQVAERFRKLEELLIRLAEVEATENPERAALLRRAAKQSRESFILDRLSAASEALSGSQYQQAIDAQQAANENLSALLKLLLTEDRSERIRSEKERIANWIKDLRREERKQRAARARTENGADLDAIADEQRDILEKAGELQRKMAGDKPASSDANQADGPAEDPAKSSPDDAQPADAAEQQEPPKTGEEQEDDAEMKPGSEKSPQTDEASSPDEDSSSDATPSDQAPPSESQPSESQPSESQPSESQPSESQPSESQPSESQPSESQPSESQPSESQPSEAAPNPAADSPTPPPSPQQQAEQKLQQAIERMQQAEQELEQAQRDEATDRQREAERNLREAIDELEKILRQLREEELERELARLESRLRKMAQMQSAVLDQTQELAAIPAEARDRQTDLRSGNLAAAQKKIVLEADRAMLLLREEGSSVAFPEVVEQMRGDMQTVADRLAQTKIDRITQGIEEDILAALEEMIEALQKAQRDLEKQQQQQESMPPQQQGQPGEQPLVESLAELKLIRTMQERIKRTTDRYSEMLDEAAQPAEQDFLGLLRNLADRQSRLSSITRDIVLERNR